MQRPDFMHARRRDVDLNRSLSFMFALTLATGLVWMGVDAAPAVETAAGSPDPARTVVSVERPTGQATSPIKEIHVEP
ncbi:MAG: hypothetical protein JWQ76_806 [Ramlibacter sp.]|nr:hypothetical protein [Ramlibacter sp.]